MLLVALLWNSVGWMLDRVGRKATLSFTYVISAAIVMIFAPETPGVPLEELAAMAVS